MLGFDIYEPGTFNPLGPTLLYGDPNINKRPYMLIALNEKDQILEKSLLQYSPDGKLIAEKIFNDKNELKGEIQYFYDSNSKVTREVYFDHLKNPISLKVREYYKENLVNIKFYKNDQLILTRKYQYEKNKITGKEFSNNYIEPFIIKLKNGLVESLEFKENNVTLMKIEYIYKDNRLVQRNKTSLESQSKCVYEYDSLSRLKQFTYYDKFRNEWKKIKTIQLVYADQI